MSKKVTITIRLDEDLYKAAKLKSDKELCMPLATLIRVFLKSFTSQRGAGFYVGDGELVKLINRWVDHRDFERSRGARSNSGLFGPKFRLKDIFDLNV